MADKSPFSPRRAATPARRSRMLFTKCPGERHRAVPHRRSQREPAQADDQLRDNVRTVAMTAIRRLPGDGERAFRDPDLKHIPLSSGEFHQHRPLLPQSVTTLRRLTHRQPGEPDGLFIPSGNFRRHMGRSSRGKWVCRCGNHCIGQRQRRLPRFSPAASIIRFVRHGILFPTPMNVGHEQPRAARGRFTAVK